jgi:hypothetical protein
VGRDTHTKSGEPVSIVVTMKSLKTFFTIIIVAGLARACFGDPTSPFVERTYHVSYPVFVARLKHLLPPKPERNSTDLLIYYLHQNGVEIQPPAHVYLGEYPGEVMAIATQSDQEKIAGLIENIVMDTNVLTFITTSQTNRANGYLETEDFFVRGDKTNLIRDTHSRSGVVLFRNQTFFYNGVPMGTYMFNGGGGGITSIGSTPAGPCTLQFDFDSSNNQSAGIIKPRSAIISMIQTNNITPPTISVVTLDWFSFSNGVFYPRETSWIRDINSKRGAFPLH